MALTQQQRATGSLLARGDIVSYLGSDPAAGAEWSETVPAGKIWRLLSVIATLVTDATVANRAPRIIIDDGANVLLRLAAGTAQTASQTIAYTGAPHGDRLVDTTGTAHIPLPQDLILPAGYRIRSLTGAIVAGDNWGAPVFQVEEVVF